MFLNLNFLNIGTNVSKMALPFVLVLLASYLLGSINTSILFSKLVAHDDVRDHGSGNAGMTNVLRTFGKVPAIITFVFDFIKCAVAILLAHYVISRVALANGMSEDWAIIIGYFAGYACMLGHMYPLYFGFRGGKGVVTSTAMILFIDWRCFIVVFVTFAIAFVWKKIISLGSILGAVAFAVSTFVINYLFDYNGSPLANHGDKSGFYLCAVTVLAVMLSATVIIKHKDNIKRLLNGTEKPIISKKNK